MRGGVAVDRGGRRKGMGENRMTRLTIADLNAHIAALREAA